MFSSAEPWLVSAVTAHLANAADTEEARIYATEPGLKRAHAEQ